MAGLDSTRRFAPRRRRNHSKSSRPCAIAAGHAAHLTPSCEKQTKTLVRRNNPVTPVAGLTPPCCILLHRRTRCQVARSACRRDPDRRMGVRNHLDQTAAERLSCHVRISVDSSERSARLKRGRTISSRANEWPHGRCGTGVRCRPRLPATSPSRRPKLHSGAL